MFLFYFIPFFLHNSNSGSHRYLPISTCPLLLKVTPSSSNNVR